jgi:hypothetical protein
MKRIEMVGQRYGKLVVLRYTGGRRWLCVCDCGKRATPRGIHLRNGRTIACGQHCPLLKIPLADRFAAFVDRDGPIMREGLKRCHVWTGSADPKWGYGRFGIGGRPKLATHVAWFLKFGSWPKDCLLHRCDNPPCVRVSHLFEGSRADNTADAISKGRILRGESATNALLTEKSVREIRCSRERAIVLAERYGVSRFTIVNVRRTNRRIWAHVK